MVGGQTASAGYTRVNELVSLDPGRHEVPVCLRQRSQYPESIRAAVGAPVYGGRRDVLVCGGVTFHDYRSERCYVYNPATNNWHQGARMLMNRDNAGASVHQYEGLIVTGGSDRSVCVDFVLRGSLLFYACRPF